MPNPVLTNYRTFIDREKREIGVWWYRAQTYRDSVCPENLVFSTEWLPQRPKVEYAARDFIREERVKEIAALRAATALKQELGRQAKAALPQNRAKRGEGLNRKGRMQEPPVPDCPEVTPLPMAPEGVYRSAGLVIQGRKGRSTAEKIRSNPF